MKAIEILKKVKAQIESIYKLSEGFGMWAEIYAEIKAELSQECQTCGGSGVVVVPMSMAVNVGETKPCPCQEPETSWSAKSDSKKRLKGLKRLLNLFII